MRKICILKNGLEKEAYFYEDEVETFLEHQKRLKEFALEVRKGRLTEELKDHIEKIYDWRTVPYDD